MQKPTTAISRIESGVEHGRSVKVQGMAVIHEEKRHDKRHPVRLVFIRDVPNLPLCSRAKTLIALQFVDEKLLEGVVPGDTVPLSYCYTFPPTPYTDYTIVTGRDQAKVWKGKGKEPITIRVRELHRFGEPRPDYEKIRAYFKSHFPVLRKSFEKKWGDNEDIYFGIDLTKDQISLLEDKSKRERECKFVEPPDGPSFDHTLQRTKVCLDTGQELVVPLTFDLKSNPDTKFVRVAVELDYGQDPEVTVTLEGNK